MKLLTIGPNCHVLEDYNIRILFSYCVPVAAWIEGVGRFKTFEKFSTTTSKHINAWINGSPVDSVPQEFFSKFKMSHLDW
jgi:hypothetical protein